MTDARILGKQLVWASTTDLAKNNAYNIVNGDIFRWNWMWPRIAKWFGVEWEGFAGAPSRWKARWPTTPKSGRQWGRNTGSSSPISRASLRPGTRTSIWAGRSR